MDDVIFAHNGPYRNICRHHYNRHCVVVRSLTDMALVHRIGHVFQTKEAGPTSPPVRARSELAIYHCLIELTLLA